MPLQMFLLGLNSFLVFARKVGLICVVVLTVLFLFLSFRKIDSKQHAGGPTVEQAAEARRIKMYDELSEKKDSLFAEQEVPGRRLQRWALCLTIGELCTQNPNEAYNFKKDSLTAKMAGLLAMPLNTPPSSLMYVAKDTLENAGFVQKTFAAGIGFYALSSFQPIWVAFRDLAYLVIVIVIIVVGFMVMFGVGGGGKTSVNLESALPRLVIALLAIAFSYAIAGLFIDLMYIAIVLVVSLLGSQAGITGPAQSQLASQIISGSPVDLFWQMLGDVGHSDTNYWVLATSLYNIVPGYMMAVVDGIGNMAFGTILGSLLTTKYTKIGMSDVLTHPGSWVGSWGKIAGGFLSPIAKLQGYLEKGTNEGGGIWGLSTISLLLNIVISLIVQQLLGPLITKSFLMIILILSMMVVGFRVFFALLWIYVDILLSILFAPILLIFEAIPGQNAFLKWMKGLLINLSVFPLIIVIMLIVRILMSNANPVPMWSPPFVAQITDQLSLQMLLGGILLYSIPQLIKTYRQKMGAESMLGSMNLGVGAMFVGAAPLITGSSQILGASGISGAMAKKIGEPLRKALNLGAHDIVEVAKTQNPTS